MQAHHAFDELSDVMLPPCLRRFDATLLHCFRCFFIYFIFFDTLSLMPFRHFHYFLSRLSLSCAIMLPRFLLYAILYVCLYATMLLRLLFAAADA